jgi:hypothetical protein
MGMGMAQTRGIPPPGIAGQGDNSSFVTPSSAPGEGQGIVSDTRFSPVAPKPAPKLLPKPAPGPVRPISLPTRPYPNATLSKLRGFGRIIPYLD